MLIDICGTEFDLEHPTSIYVNCDCMMGMKQFPDKYFDLAVVDPPYGININNSMGRRKGDKQSEYPKAYWDNTPPHLQDISKSYSEYQNTLLYGEETISRYRLQNVF